MTSHSSTSRFNSCPWAYKLHKEGLHKIEDGVESNKLAFGKAGHAALQAHYQGRSVMDGFDASYPTDLDPTDNVWCREGGFRTLEAYAKYYAEIDKQWEILDTEVKDSEEETSLIVDLVARHRQSGSLYFWDHKFKEKMPWNASKRYEIDAQITRYTDWFITKYGDCAGALINIIVPGFRQRAYKGEPAGWHFKFERIIVGRTHQQIEFWRESQSQWESLIKHCEEVNHYPKQLGFSCPNCPYYEACYSGMDDEVVNTLYTDEATQPMMITIED